MDSSLPGFMAENVVPSGQIQGPQRSETGAWHNPGEAHEGTQQATALCRASLSPPALSTPTLGALGSFLLTWRSMRSRGQTAMDHCPNTAGRAQREWKSVRTPPGRQMAKEFVGEKLPESRDSKDQKQRRTTRTRGNGLYKNIQEEMFTSHQSFKKCKLK